MLANYRYFVSGGPERYLFSIKSQLETKGHVVVPFSVDLARNESTVYSKYFVSPIGSRDEIYFSDHKMSFLTVLKSLDRLFYSKEVERAVARLVDEVNPSVAYVLHYLKKLSPSLVVSLKKRKVPVIVRLSDYNMLCPQAHFLKNNNVCTLCMGSSLFSSVLHKCVRNSYLASLLNYLAFRYYENRKFFNLIDCFVCTNDFMRDIMIKAGFSATQLHVIPTFADSENFYVDRFERKENYIAYVGRITHEKGIHDLIKAFSQVLTCYDTKLLIAGAGDKAYLDDCRQLVASLGHFGKIVFLGELSTSELRLLLNKAKLSVVPSIWFENLPNSMLESFACGTPVIASNIGSLAESIDHEFTGMLFECGSVEDLANKIYYCLNNPDLLASMSANALLASRQVFSPDIHVESLLSLFNQCI